MCCASTCDTQSIFAWLEALPSGGSQAQDAGVDDARYQRIEERVAWLEKHVLEQDKAMLELARGADSLRRQLAEMRERLVPGASPGQAAGEIFDGEEKPPHY